MMTSGGTGTVLITGPASGLGRALAQRAPDVRGRGVTQGAAERAAQERAARIAQHFERARHWEAVEDAEQLHRAEKEHR